MKRRTCALILENKNHEILFQLRDNKPEILFPNCWTTFGGQIELNETPEEAIKREIREELNYELDEFEFFRHYEEENFEVFVYRKFDGNVSIGDFKVCEGQAAEFFSLNKLKKLRFAFNTKKILKDYIKSFGLR